MAKSILLYIAALSLCALVVSLVVFAKKTPLESTVPEPVATDYKNATYVIDGTLVTLKDGESQVQISNSSSKVITRYFGNELFKDLNADGRDDAIFLLTQESGGTGIFYYVVAALNTETGYVGSQALLLGDRIAPQTTESGPSKEIIVNYADRAAGEAMTTQPSLGKSLRLILDINTMQFGEVAADFEGEADPNSMTLGMKSWAWQKTEYKDGQTIIPVKPGVFTLTFATDGTVSIGTDCNNAGARYKARDTSIEFSEFHSTLMYCEDSQETKFFNMIESVESLDFTSRGELILNLARGNGTVTFR